MNHRDAVLTDVIIVLEALNDEQTAVVVQRLEAVGLSVTNVDNDISTVEGTIPSEKVHDLHMVECVRYVRSVTTYAVDYPPGDPRDQDGVEEGGDESGD